MLDYLPAGPDPLLTHRVQSSRVDVITRDGEVVGPLRGVTDWTVNADADRTLHTGGSLKVTVLDPPQVDSWVDLRVRVWEVVAGVEPWPLATLLCAAPKAGHSATGTVLPVDLMDLLALVDRAKTAVTFSIPAGAVVTDQVRTLLAPFGPSAVTASTKVLASAMVWEPLTSTLRIINDLLDAIGYWSLRTDTLGRFVAAPYTAPTDRVPVRDVTADAIVSPTWDEDRDLASVPNRWVLVGQSSSTTPGLVGVAENNDPADPLSIPNRGVVAGGRTGVEAVDQATIDAMAARELRQASAPSATRTVSFAVVPLSINDVIVHRGTRCSVNAWSVSRGAGALMQATLREV